MIFLFCVDLAVPTENTIGVGGKWADLGTQIEMKADMAGPEPDNINAMYVRVYGAKDQWLEITDRDLSALRRLLWHAGCAQLKTDADAIAEQWGFAHGFGKDPNAEHKMSVRELV